MWQHLQAMNSNDVVTGRKLALYISMSFFCQAVASISINNGERYVDSILTEMVRSGDKSGEFTPDFRKVQSVLQASESFGMLAHLYLFGVPDENGKLELPRGHPRDIAQAVQYAIKGMSGSQKGDSWSFTVLAFLLSLDHPSLHCLRLETKQGSASVEFKGVEDVILKRSCTSHRKDVDIAGAMYWAATARNEPVGSIVLASLLRRNLTQVPRNLDQVTPVLARAPILLTGAQQGFGSDHDLICRAVGPLKRPASEAVRNEVPLLDRSMLSWRAWQHKKRHSFGEPDWMQTREYLNTLRYHAEQRREPAALRELGSVHYKGHSAGDIEKSHAYALKYWIQAARSGDAVSAWYVAQTFMQQKRLADAEHYVDLVAGASVGALTEMAFHVKYRFGLGVKKDSKLAGEFLKRAADLGNSDAQIALADAYVGRNPDDTVGVDPPGGLSSTLAFIYLKKAAANGRLSPKFNVGLLTMEGADPAITGVHEQCQVAFQHFSEIIMRAHPAVHLLFAHAIRAYDRGDEFGALLRFGLLSDAGALIAHRNAAFLWDEVKVEVSVAGSKSVLPECWIADGDPDPYSACAFYYHRRAASSGHVSAMHEVSKRYLKAEGLPKILHDNNGSAIAYAWTALAAEQGDQRGLFDLAYMTQFGIGIAANESHAQTLYWKLFHEGDWSGRISSLSGLALQHLRSYFLSVVEKFRPATSLLGAFFTRARSSFLGWKPLSRNVEQDIILESIMLQHTNCTGACVG